MRLSRSDALFDDWSRDAFLAVASTLFVDLKQRYHVFR